MSRRGRGLEIRGGWGCLIAVAGLLAVVGAAAAQTANCERLRAALDAMGPVDGGGDALYARAAERQRAEIDRTRDYAASQGCGNPAENGFDDDQPRQCAGLTERLARMEDNLSQIEARVRQHAGDGGERARLRAQVAASCTPDDVPRPAVSEDGDDAPGLRTAPLDPDGAASESKPAASPHGAQAICVRSCDGGYFPLGQNATPDQLDGLEQLCKASCPNTEAHLYTMAEEGKLDGATSVDGQPYAALPAAFRFEKSFTPSCTCKPPGQSWVQALAEADKLLEVHEGDVTVTRQMSEDMAKPAPVPQPTVVAKPKPRKRADRRRVPPPDVAAVPDPSFDGTVR